MKTKKQVPQRAIQILSYLYLIFSFGILDVWLRVMTRWINAYSIYSIAPNLFTLLWSVILATLVKLIPSRKIGGVIYGVAYYAFLIYAVVQYGAYLVLGKLLFISDFLYASEGMSFLNYALKVITPALVAQVALLAAVGGIGCISIQKTQRLARKSCLFLVGIVLAGAVGILLTPMLYGEEGEADRWDNFFNPAAEYRRFVNPNFDLELTGMYQYLVRDSVIQLKRSTKSVDMDAVQDVRAFFEEKKPHTENGMTGIFKGKNLIVFMLESTDDWLINETDTPTLYYMMNHGIHLNHMYTPGYSNGYTFNTEFAFNTSVYPYSNGNVAYTLVNNCFDLGIANMFRRNLYTVNSFHEGISTFYNRGAMHETFGYQRYHAYSDYPELDMSILDDRYLVKNELLYSQVIKESPFYSYVITYGGHLPYDVETDEYSRYALEQHPEYKELEDDEEIAILRAKIHLTDDMFAELLSKLEADGILEDTVIIGFADHYAYGLTDKERLQQLSEEAGSSILERTPAFIYCAGNKLGITVDKVMQITDLAPTIMNLFGLEVPKEIMGQDVFDENYQGYAIFPNNTWLTNEAYMKNGVLQWNNGMSDEEIAQMNAYVQKVYVINDKILDTDYYAHKAE